jgi:hypothetical protein
MPTTSGRGGGSRLLRARRDRVGQKRMGREMKQSVEGCARDRYSGMQVGVPVNEARQYRGHRIGWDD